MVSEGEVFENVGSNQFPGKADGHIMLGIHHFRTQHGENLALLLAFRLGNNPFHAHFQHRHGGEDADIQFFADADNGHVRFLDAGFSEVVCVQLTHHKGIVGKAQCGVDFFTFTVDDHDFFPFGCQFFGKCEAESSQSDDGKQSCVLVSFLILSHSVRSLNLFRSAGIQY